MTTVQKTLLLAMTLLCSSCAQVSEVPPASLKFKGYAYHGGLSYYLKLESDQMLERVFNVRDKRDQASPMIVCSLDRDTNFDVNHRINARGTGFLQADESADEPGRFHYQTALNFNTTEQTDIATAVPVTSGEALENLLLGQATIPCQVNVTSYGFKPYYSRIVEIPTAPLIVDLKKRNTLERH